MDVHEYLGVLRRGIVLIVLWVALGLLAGAAIQSVGSPGYTIVGGVLGLAVGILAAFLREALDTRVRSPRAIAAIARIPILGQIPADRRVLTSPLVTRGDSDAPIAEAFRALRVRIDHLRVRDGQQAFVITAAGPGQGSTTVTANLAVALANTSTSVVVVDADLRSSALSRLFGIRGAPGLAEVLAGRVPLDAVLQSRDGGRMTVVPAGGRPSNPGELLATPAMREVLAELRRRFAVVLIDTPAISAVADAAVLGSYDSATLLVLAEGSITRPRLEDALSLLASGGSVPVGIVLDAIPRRSFGRRPARADEPVPAEAPEVKASALKPVAQEPAAPEPGEPDPVAQEPLASADEPAEDPVPAASAPRVSFGSVPTASAAEQLTGSIELDIEPSVPVAIERPIVVRPDPPKPASRFAPDPSKIRPGVGSAYAGAPAPAVGTERRLREPVTGTVVDTVSVAILREEKEAATIPPPIRHILPAPTSGTIPRKALGTGSRPRKGDAPDLPPDLEHEPVGSLLGEIGGLPRVEVRAARQVSLSDSGPNPERQARESYELRARELERVAHDRLMREQQRLAVTIREQLAHDKRELESVLDNRLEDTVLRPIALTPRRAADPRSSDAGGDDGATR